MAKVKISNYTQVAGIPVEEVFAAVDIVKEEKTVEVKLEKFASKSESLEKDTELVC